MFKKNFYYAAEIAEHLITALIILYSIFFRFAIRSPLNYTKYSMKNQRKRFRKTIEIQQTVWYNIYIVMVCCLERMAIYEIKTAEQHYCNLLQAQQR